MGEPYHHARPKEVPQGWGSKVCRVCAIHRETKTLVTVSREAHRAREPRKDQDAEFRLKVVHVSDNHC